MQRIFLTLATAMGLSLASGATVLAADVARPVYKAPPPAPAVYSWTGFISAFTAASPSDQLAGIKHFESGRPR